MHLLSTVVGCTVCLLVGECSCLCVATQFMSRFMLVVYRFLQNNKRKKTSLFLIHNVQVSINNNE